MKLRRYTKEDIERDMFIREIMVGDCPNCGSFNTHDCSKDDFDCEVAKMVDDPTVGHCDDCGYLWCLECGSELTIENHVCGHWSICGECGKTDEFPPTCPYKAEAEAGELLVDPCLLDCPYLDECPKCPYIDEIEKCPKIKYWKNNPK